MVALSFECVDAAARDHAAAPTLEFRLRITEPTGARIGAIALRVQVRIQPLRRRYSEVEGTRLADLFGTPERWPDTMRPMQFATVPVTVPAFAGSTEVSLDVACSYDLEVAVGRYFHSLDDGTVPLLMLFSGSVFRAGERGLSVEPVPWHAEAHHRLPVRVWHDLMDRYFPDSGWLRLSRDTLHALGEVKSRHALPTWDGTVRALLDAYHPDPVAAPEVRQ